MVGDLDQNVAKILAAMAAAEREEADLAVFPKHRGHRLSPRGSAAQTGLRRGEPAGARPARSRERPVRRRGRIRGRGRGLVQRGGRARRRQGPRRLAQTAPPQLRRVRRAPVLRHRDRSYGGLRDRRCPYRGHGVRGRMEPCWTGSPARVRRSGAGRRGQRVSLPERSDPRAAPHARDSGGGRVDGSRVRQPRRRPGSSSSSTAARWSSTTTACSWRQRPSSKSVSTWSTSTSSPRTASACSTHAATRARRCCRLLPSPGLRRHSSGARPSSLPTRSRRGWPGSSSTPEEVYRALVVGTRDYVEKGGFEAVLIALSGGVDSSLVATVAVDALGPSRGPRRPPAVALLEQPLDRRRRSARGAISASTSARSRSSPLTRRCRRCSSPPSRRGAELSSASLTRTFRLVHEASS